MAENEKKISQEFITNVKKYLEIDDLLKDIKEKTKKLTTDKKRPRAIKFYEDLGFKATHQGMKMHFE